jgi:hypothetical protein
VFLRKVVMVLQLTPSLFSTYVPSGDSQGLLEALMATSPRKSPAPRKSIASGSAKPRKSIKISMKGRSNDETAEEFTQEMEKQTKLRKSTGRKSIRVVASSEEQTQGMALAMTFRKF